MKFSVEPMTPVTHAVVMGAVVVDLCNPLSTDPVTISLGTNPTVGSVLTGTLTVNAVKGVAYFNNLQISLAGNGYTLVATAPQQRPPFYAEFQPGVVGHQPCCEEGGCFFQAGYYYNYPPSGEADFPNNTVFPLNGFQHGNYAVTPVTESVTSDPFNVV